MSNQNEMWKQLMTRAQKQKQPQNLISAQATTKAVQAQMPNLQTMNAPQVQQAQQITQTNQQAQAPQVQATTTSPQSSQQAYNELLKNSQYTPQLSQQDRFKQWWNENAGVGEFDDSKGYYRTDAMDETTYRIGQNMYDGYLQKQDLLTEYQAQQERLNREKYQQEANANYQKWLMQKYLPDVLNKNGYSGNLGLVRDANLGIDNTYSRNLSNINESYNDTMQDVTSDYNSNVRAINENISNKNDVLYDKQEQENNNIASEWYAQLYEGLETLKNNENTTIEDWDKYIEKIKKNDKLGEYKELLTDYAETQKAESISIENEKTKQDIINGVTPIEYGGSKYRLTRKLDNNANEITQNDSFTKALSKAGFDNPFNSTIPNGFSVKINCDNSGRDKFNFVEDVLSYAILVLPAWGAKGWSTHSKTLTYYDGNWYESKKV